MFIIENGIDLKMSCFFM